MNFSHRLVFVDPASLGDNPRNWRTHPPDQCAAFEGLLAEVGWLQPILYNETTRRLLDGHMRRAKAVELKLPAVPVVIVEVPEHLEPQALASLDTLGMGAGVDAAAFADLLRDVNTASAELGALFADVAEGFGIGAGTGDDEADGTDGDSAEESPADEEPEPESPAADILWPSSNELGIPDLLPQLQAEGVVFPATLWGTVGKAKSMPGTWVTYTRDDRLERLWYDPTGLLESRPAAAIEPNFSTHPQMPTAVVVWATYRKRWIARFWQSRGVRVFVDLSVAPEWAGLNLVGVPQGWRSYATRAHADGGGVEAIEAHHRAAVEHAGTDQITFVVYGGWKSTRDLCAARGWAWIPEQLHKARGEDLPALTPEVADGTR